MLKSHALRKKFLFLILLSVLINTISMYVFYSMEIFPSIENIYKKDISNEIEKEYKTKKEMQKALKKVEKKYNISITTNNQNEILIFAKNIKVNNEEYLIFAYKSLNIKKIMLNLIIFQTIIVSIIILLISMLASKKIITPIESIINDIKNYKFGKKPKKRKVKSELDLIQNEFVNLTDTLEKEKKEQKRIIASISHDIKTPLTSVIGYSSLVSSPKATEKEMRKFSKKINEKSNHIKNILNSFDDYLTNYDNKELKLDTIQVKDLVKELNDDYKFDLEGSGIEFHINNKLKIDYLNVDILKLKRIFSNIISNSIRYAATNICINIYDDEKYIYFKIKDNGEGVDEKIIDKIFEPFYTTDRSRKISGLGLSICKEFTLMHKGDIKAYNDNGFTIIFSISKDLGGVKK